MRWYVERSGKVRGPFEEEGIRELIANGKIDSGCRLRGDTDSEDAWRRLDEINEFDPVPNPRAIAQALPSKRAVDRTTLNIERLERAGRLLLWLALAATIVLVPIGLAKERRTEAETLERIKEATRAAEQKFDALAKSITDKQPQRIMYSSIGNGLSALNTDNATGQLWFTNVSSNVGHVCVVGEVTNPATHANTESLPACVETPAYAGAHLTVMFAGGDLSAVCKGGPCNLHMKDAN
jgi:hypothetical protein